MRLFLALLCLGLLAPAAAVSMRDSKDSTLSMGLEDGGPEEADDDDATGDDDDGGAAMEAAAPQETRININHVFNDTPDPVTYPVPGTDSICYGLDIFDGNPGAQMIFKMSYNQFSNGINNLNEANKQMAVISKGEKVLYKMPDQVDFAGPFYKCEQAGTTSSTVVKSSEELSQAESQTISVEGEVGTSNAKVKGGYSASEMASQYNAAASEGRTEAILTDVKATVYQFAIVDLPPLTVEFTDAVRELCSIPTEAGDGPYLAFLKRFGTHWMKEGKLGGKISQMTTYTSGSLTSSSVAAEEKETAYNIGVSVEDKKGAMGVEGGRENKSESSKGGDSVSETNKSVGSKVFLGGEPSEEWTEWCQSVTEAPVVIESTVRPITELMKAVPDLNPEQITGVVTKITDLMSSRCKCLNGAKCDKETNACICEGQYTGDNCEIAPIVQYTWKACQTIPNSGSSGWWKKDLAPTSKGLILALTAREDMAKEQEYTFGDKCSFEDGTMSPTLQYTTESWPECGRLKGEVCQCPLGQFISHMQCMQDQGKGDCLTWKVTCSAPMEHGGTVWRLGFASSGTHIYVNKDKKKDIKVLRPACSPGYIASKVEWPNWDREDNRVKEFKITCSQVEVRDEGTEVAATANADANAGFAELESAPKTCKEITDCKACLGIRPSGIPEAERCYWKPTGWGLNGKFSCARSGWTDMMGVSVDRHGTCHGH